MIIRMRYHCKYHPSKYTGGASDQRSTPAASPRKTRVTTTVAAVTGTTLASNSSAVDQASTSIASFILTKTMYRGFTSFFMFFK